MADCMSFPKEPMDFIKGYSFVDSDEVYTNGAELVPLFRVEQMLEHYHKPYKNEEEIAKEYDEFDVIYKKVCELEKQYAKGAEDWENVNRCIRLENLLQYFKEQLIPSYQKGE